jgi:predicted RNA-binding Zn-ribbon protein involved in translation (DUF1610 family)
MSFKRTGNSKGGRVKAECPNCGNRDRKKMCIGARGALGICDCGWVFDIDTGRGYMTGHLPSEEKPYDGH